MFIDIHNHGLYGVDDGAKDFEESLRMLKEAVRQGGEAVIFTPHYSQGMFPYQKESIIGHFKELEPEAARMGIRLYLGCEYHMDSQGAEVFRSGRCFTLAGGDYVLVEFSYGADYPDMLRSIQKVLLNGYIPVVAHAERYMCLVKKAGLCCELSGAGAMIQVNADSVLGLDGRMAERFCGKLLKNGWVDIVASDAHGIAERTCHMGDCRALVERKYGAAFAERVFVQNPAKILEDNITRAGTGDFD